MYFIWKKEYETGVEKIDKQHLGIVNLINKLHKEVVEDANSTSLAEIIMDLKIYTISHFATEEKLFKKSGFEGEEKEKHLKKHEDFVNKISEFMGDTTSSQNELAYRVTEYLKNWLIHHILDTDMEFASYLKKHHFTEINITEDITYEE